MSHTCILCGKSDLDSSLPISGFGDSTCFLVRCQYCGTYQPSVFLSQKDHSNMHNEPRHGAHASKFSLPGLEGILDIFRKYRAHNIAKLLGRKGIVLDFGCGNGRFLYHLSKRGDFKLIGTELPGKQKDYAASHDGITILSDGADLDTRLAEGLDAITMFHVIEHLTDPVEVLRKLIPKLNYQGYLIVSLPNIESLQARIFGSKWLHLDPGRHVFFPPMGTLIKFMQDQDMELIHYHSYSLEQNPFGFLQSLLNVFSRDRDVLFNAMKGSGRNANKARLFLHGAFLLVMFPIFALTDRIIGLGKLGATATLTFRKTR